MRLAILLLLSAVPARARAEFTAVRDGVLAAAPRDWLPELLREPFNEDRQRSAVASLTKVKSIKPGLDLSIPNDLRARLVELQNGKQPLLAGLALSLVSPPTAAEGLGVPVGCGYVAHEERDLAEPVRFVWLACRKDLSDAYENDSFPGLRLEVFLKDGDGWSRAADLRDVTREAFEAGRHRGPRGFQLLARSEQCFEVHSIDAGRGRLVLRFCDEGGGRQYLAFRSAWKPVGDHDELLVTQYSGDFIERVAGFRFDSKGELRSSPDAARDAAVPELDRQLAEPRSAATVVNAGLCYGLLGKPEEGIALIDTFMKAHPPTGPGYGGSDPQAALKSRRAELAKALLRRR